MRRTPFRWLLAVALLLGLAAAAAAAKKPRDQIWTRPDYDRLGIDRIALIPVTSFDNALPNENLVEASIGQSLKSTGYRWISGTSTREMLRARAGSDSLLRALRTRIVAAGRLDSASSPGVASMLGSDAMLTVRIDQFEQHEPEWNVAGKPYTVIQLRAALVDSVGRLLWSASSTEIAEGPYYDPNTSPIAVKDSGLERKPMSNQGGAPSYREVLSTLLTRWSAQFPPHASPRVTAADSAATPR